MITAEFVRSTMKYPDFLNSDEGLTIPSNIIHLTAQSNITESLDLIIRLARQVNTDSEFENVRAISMCRVGIQTADGEFVGSDLWWLVRIVLLNRLLIRSSIEGRCAAC